MKLKARNGNIFTIERVFTNYNVVTLWMDYYAWGIGLDIHVGDSNIMIQVDILCLHLEIWI